VDQYVAYDSTSAQGLWFKNDLATSNKPWKFVLLHEPGWSASNGCGTGHANNATVQTQIEPFCERYGVAMVFAGHNHYYARAVVNGIHHVTTGGGGAPPNTGCTAGQPNLFTYVSAYEFCRVAIDGGVLHFQATNTTTGAVIDSFTVVRTIPDMTPPSVTITSPNGGESFITTSPQTLTWTATDDVGVSSVEVLLSRNGTGGPFETLYSGPNSNSLEWTVVGPPSDNCYLKVAAQDTAGNTGSDLSDRPFAIVDVATPTLLSQFAATPLPSGIELRWRFSQPERFGPVTVERAPAAAGPWTDALVERREEEGTSIALDRNVQDGRAYWYHLNTTSGASPYTFGPIEAMAGEAIREFALSRPVPNPTPSGMRVDYAVPRAARLDLSLFDMQGRHVATLVDGLVPAGRNQAVWDGSVGGRQAPAGVYFLRLKSPGVNLTRRLVVTR
jgi:hypothetical protein